MRKILKTNKLMDYHLIRSSRRTVALIIRNGNLIVRAPRRADLAEIERFIRAKQGWIQKHLAKAANRQSPKKKYQDGEKFWFLGQEYPLHITDDYRSKLFYDGDQFILSQFQIHKAKSLFENWYRVQAKKILAERAIFFADKMGLLYKKITITGANTRWGSCSGKGTVNFSWRLIMAPLEIVDYVTVHELAHLAHHNHSKSFWLYVKNYYPDYKSAKNWLKEKGHEFG